MAVENKDELAALWLGRALRAWPHQGAAFLETERDPFRNPVGNTLRQAIAILLDELLGGMDQGRLTPALDSLMQIRAVGDLPPSQALEFLFQLKEVMRTRIAGAEKELLDRRIDEVALEAFDLYMKYRERTWQARSNEIRRRHFVLERLERGGI